MNANDLFKLTELGVEINAQDSRSTQWPIFVIKQKVKAYGDSDWRENSERKEGNDRSEICESCDKLLEADKDLPDYCEDCPSDHFIWFDWEDETVDNCGFFFSAKAAQHHIDLNHYHYNKPFVYAVSAWRNPELQTILNLLSRLGNNGEALEQYK